MKNFGQKMDNLARLMLPGVITIMLFTLTLLPIGFTGLADFPPHICLISLFYWTIFYPQTMPYWFAFALGLLVDSLQGISLLGLSSLIFIIFRFTVLVQQRLLARESFFALWFSFGLGLITVQLLYWVILTLYNGQAVSIEAALMQWVFTFGIYPLAHIGFSLLYRFLPQLSGSSPLTMKRKK